MIWFTVVVVGFRPSAVARAAKSFSVRMPMKVSPTNGEAPDIAVTHPSCSVSKRGAWRGPFDSSAHQLSKDHGRTPCCMVCRPQSNRPWTLPDRIIAICEIGAMLPVILFWFNGSVDPNQCLAGWNRLSLQLERGERLSRRGWRMGATPHVWRSQQFASGPIDRARRLADSGGVSNSISAGLRGT